MPPWNRLLTGLDDGFSFGRFMICSGATMFVSVAFVFFGGGPLLERIFGDAAAPYVYFVILGFLVLIALEIERRLRPWKGMILGGVGWLGVFILTYLFATR